MHAWLVDMLLLLSMVNFSTTAEYIFVLGPKKNSCSKRIGRYVRRRAGIAIWLRHLACDFIQCTVQ
jgi:hypothetical protein